MNAILTQVAPVTNQVVAAVLNSLWEGAAATALVWFCLSFFRRLNATTRYVIWCALLVSVSGLTFMDVTGGLISMRVVQDASKQERVANSEAAFFAPVEAVAVIGPSRKTGAVSRSLKEEIRQPEAVGPSPLLVFSVGGTWSVWIVCGWGIVSLLLLARLVISYLHLRPLKEHSKPLGDLWEERFSSLLENARITRRIGVGASDDVTMPLAIGLRDNPVVLIPNELPVQLEASELDQVLLHEAAHLARRDDWSNLVQRVLAALFFFNPAVLWISRRLSLEREIACDDWVTGVTGRTKSYALCLTKLAELTRLGSHQVLASSAWISRPQLSRRIAVLLDRKQNRTNRVSIAACAAALFSLGALLLVFLQVGQVVAADNPPSLAPSGATASTPGTAATSGVNPLPGDTAQIQVGAAEEDDPIARRDRQIRQLKQELDIANENDPISKRDHEIQKLKQELEVAKRLQEIRRENSSTPVGNALLPEAGQTGAVARNQDDSIANLDLEIEQLKQQLDFANENDPISKRERQIQKLKHELEVAKRLQEVRRENDPTSLGDAAPSDTGQTRVTVDNDDDPIVRRDRQIQQLKQELDTARRLEELRRGLYADNNAAPVRTEQESPVESAVAPDAKPYGIAWQTWSPEAVQKALSERRPVLVDFTAKWCVASQLNRKSSIEIPSVRAKLKEINAVALRGDYSAVPENITEELKRFGRAGVPLVLVYQNATNPPIVLPELLTPGTVLEALGKAAP